MFGHRSALLLTTVLLMKIALINPPSPFLIDQKAFPPLGLLSLAAYLRECSPHQPVVYDLAGKESDLPLALKGIEADIYAVTASTPQYPHALAILKELRRQKPAARILIGGIHATTATDACLNDGWDNVVIREGEQAIVQLAHDQGEGPRLVVTDYLDDLDRLPFPAYDLVDVLSYGYSLGESKAITLITSRGCPFRCAFCSKEVWSNTVRFHRPLYVEQLVRHLRDRFGFRSLLFLDDNLTLQKSRLLEIMARLEPLEMSWRCYGHVNTIDREMLTAMRRAGCVEIGVGIESGSQKILDVVNKKTTVEQNTAFIQMCREEGIETNAFIMIGLPGESEETFERDQNLDGTSPPGQVRLQHFSPLSRDSHFSTPGEL